MTARLIVPSFLTQALFRLTDPSGRRIVYDAKDIKLMAPVPHPSKLLELALSYPGDPDRETTDPIFSPKGYEQSIIGYGDIIRFPRESRELVSEIELGLIVGRRAYKVTDEDAYNFIAGYTVFNDTVDVDIVYQEKRRMHFRGDSFPTFAPIGPCLTLKEDIPDPNNLKVTCRINGEVKQTYKTRDMLFKVGKIVSFISRSLILEPGDTISCGAHPGWRECIIKPGDIVEGEIESIGILRNPVASEE